MGAYSSRAFKSVYCYEQICHPHRLEYVFWVKFWTHVLDTTSKPDHLPFSDVKSAI